MKDWIDFINEPEPRPEPVKPEPKDPPDRFTEIFIKGALAAADTRAFAKRLVEAAMKEDSK